MPTRRTHFLSVLPFPCGVSTRRLRWSARPARPPCTSDYSCRRGCPSFPGARGRHDLSVQTQNYSKTVVVKSLVGCYLETTSIVFFLLLLYTRVYSVCSETSWFYKDSFFSGQYKCSDPLRINESRCNENEHSLLVRDIHDKIITKKRLSCVRRAHVHTTRCSHMENSKDYNVLSLVSLVLSMDKN